MSPIPLGILAASGAGGEYLIYKDLLESFEHDTPDPNSLTTISFTGLDSYSDYTDLEVVMVAQSNESGSGHNDLRIRYNDISTSDYTWHYLESTNGSLNSQSYSSIAGIYGENVLPKNSEVNNFGCMIMRVRNFLDPVKLKTTSISGGMADDYYGYSQLTKAMSVTKFSSPINKIEFYAAPGFSLKTTFALYGIRGA